MGTRDDGDNAQTSIAAGGEEEDVNQDFWLFGYGSLVWKPPPHYDEILPGYIKGYVRRFWQASEDHRGTPEAPGRVVTLIDEAHWKTLSDDYHTLTTSTVWGAAYHIPSSHAAEVRSYLDIREINGYSIQYTPFYPSSTSYSSSVPSASPSLASPSNSNPSSISNQSPLKCMVYIGLPCNPQFLGPQPPQQLAAHILKSKGPSGENKEYLYMLGQALEELSPESGDEHIRDLVRRCRVLERGEEKGEGEGEIGGELKKVGSSEEQEEVEK
ncbi:ChaC-domain-containing protein [Aulographum hederae CBS 113979]|uniref:glutathione-specific gamma-glutamylcyclotransferase n=1 Tax=Aulographum hederae CBS 113979 TaxID=1176131 RepID=A0A6G1GL58_9PEZI|nr:ChaC-domain-containing protein [Aulographum hederae CBS 113979]